MSQTAISVPKKHVKQFVIDDFNFLVCEKALGRNKFISKKQKSVIKFTSLKSNRLCLPQKKKLKNNYGNDGEYNIGL